MDGKAQGRVAVVTGVGRTAGIGFAIARRLLGDGYRVLVHSLDGAPLDALGGPSDRLAEIEADLGEADAPRRVIEAALERSGLSTPWS